MKLIIDGDPKEIAALVLEIQERRTEMGLVKETLPHPPIRGEHWESVIVYGGNPSTKCPTCPYYGGGSG